MPVLAELSKERIIDLYMHAVKRDAAHIKRLYLENLRLKKELDRLHRQVGRRCTDAECRQGNPPN